MQYYKQDRTTNSSRFGSDQDTALNLIERPHESNEFTIGILKKNHESRNINDMNGDKMKIIFNQQNTGE